MQYIKNRRLRGVSLIEFTIVFPMAVLFIMTMIQLGLVYMAKLTVNHAAFMAARAGSMHNANKSVMMNALIRGLNPLYQKVVDEKNDSKRLALAAIEANIYARLPGGVELERLNPSAASFKDFAVHDPVAKVKYIPNDNLEWRDTVKIGATSKQNIRDANLLKLRVVYGYDLKVPIMAGVIKRMMCGGSSGVATWGNVSYFDALYSPIDIKCLKYYMQDKIPIESVVTVEMQSRAEE